MAVRVHPIFMVLNGGEMSPKLEGRIDNKRFLSGVNTMQNCIGLPQGGAKSRGGFHFVAEVKDSNAVTRLIPFRFGETQNYIIEVGNLYMRFFMNEGVILGNGTAYEIVTPYLEADLPLLKFLQDDEDMYLTHPDYATRVLTRTSHTAWTLTEVDFIDGPYEDEVEAVLSSSQVSGQTTITLVGGTSTYLFYNNEITPFSVGDEISGATSGATATVMAATDWGIAGILTITEKVGDFVNNEVLTSAGGSGQVVGFSGGNGFLTYSEKAGASFTLETITGGTSGASGELKAWHADDALTGKISLEMTTDANFVVDETVTGATSGATAKVEAFARTAGAVFLGTHFILYDNETTNFSSGETITGDSSEATAKVVSAVDWDSEGVLALAEVSGTFTDGEEIESAGGKADVNGTSGDEYLVYATEVGGPFTIAETLTGGTSAATGTLRGLQDDGADGKMVIAMATATAFAVGETITGGTSGATAIVVSRVRAQGPLFSSGDVGAPFRYYFDDTWTWLEIRTIVDNMTAVAIVRGVDIGAGPANASKYRKGAWSGTNGYPKSACFHEGRILYAGSYEFPQTVWASKVDKYATFTPGILDDDPYSFTAAQVNIIRWLASTRLLAIGALDGEVSAVGQSDGLISPTSPPVIKPETPHGSSKVDVLKLGRSLLFLQQSEKRLREFVYSYADDAYSSPDISRLAEHLFSETITELTYQQEPNSIVWARRSDGILLGCTYERSEDVVGWHKHVTDGTFESVAAIPYGNADQTWAIINRTVEGVTKRYVEYEDPDIHVDSGLTYSGDATTTITLAHLVGKTVEIVGDGAVYPSQVVPAGGVLTIDSASEVYAGLDFLPKIITNRPEVQVAGSSQSLKKRWVKIVARVIETFGIKINDQAVQHRIVGDVESADLMDTAPAPRSEDVEAEDLGWGVDGRVTIEQPLPLPMEIVCVMGTLAVGDD